MTFLDPRKGRRQARIWLALLLVAPSVATAAYTPPARLPLAFEHNQGQADPAVRFLARGPGYRIYLAAHEAVAAFDSDGLSFRMRFEGAAEPRISPSEPMAHRTNYFIGTAAVTDVPSFGRVTYGSIYPGIDLVYRGSDGLFEYDFVLAPGADARAIRLRFAGPERVTTTPAGELALRFGGDEVVFRRPVAFQERGGTRRGVEVAYALAPDGSVGFALGEYDRGLPLVIDPILAYSSFVWGAAKDVALDAEGNVYLAGFTSAADLPLAGGYRTKQTGTLDAYVVKLDPTGTRVIYATYLGARRAQTFGEAIAVDAAGNAYIVGTTDGSAFPTTRGAYQRTFAPGTSFVTKFNAAGNALVYSTFVNGARLSAIELDAAGSAYVAGAASLGSAFVTTPGAFQTVPGGGVVARLNLAGSAATYATYLGGSGDSVGGLALDASGNAWLAGTTASAGFPTVNPVQPALKGEKDAFVSLLNAAGTGLLYSTFLGGSNKDFGTAIAVDAAGDAYVVGRSFSEDFPVTFGAFQPAKGHSDPVVSNAFVAKVSASGSGLAYSSYLGGRWCLTAGVFSCFAFSSGEEGIDGATTVAVDAAGFAYVGGYANSVEFPRVDPIHGNLGPLGENERAPFVARVNPGGDRLVYSVVLGTRGVDTTLRNLVLDGQGVVHAVGLGCCGQTDRFPLTAGMPLANWSNSFLARLAPGRFPTTLASSSPRVAGGEPVTLRAEVQAPRPGGTVSFSRNGEALGEAPVTNGAAVLTVTLPPGAHRITAVNSADGVVSPPVYQLVTTP